MEMDAEEKGIGLLDLLVVVAENLRLLIFGPVVVGLLALGIGYTLPKSFVSQAIVSLPAATAAAPMLTPIPTPTSAQVAAMMVSPLVLDPVIESLKLSGGRFAQVTHAGLANQIKAAVGRDGLVRLDVTASTPIEAQTIADAVIDRWLKSTVPAGQDRADLEKRLDYAKGSLEAVNRLLAHPTVGGGGPGKRPIRDEAGTSLVAANELQARYLAETLNISRGLQGLSRDVVKQSPTLPTQPASPKKSLIATLAALGSGLALLLWVFMREAWRNAAKDPEAAKKQARLLAAIGFKGRPY